jgi:receptor protein-tyrosine kinase
VTLSDYVTALKRGWVIILAALLVMVGAVALVLTMKPDVYKSSVQLYVATVSDAAESADPERIDFTVDRLSSYAEVVRGSLVADKVEEQVGDTKDVDASVKAMDDSVVIRIDVTSSDSRRAYDVAKAYGEVAPAAIESLEKDPAGKPRVQVTVFGEPKLASEPVARAWVASLLAAAILGLGLGVTIVLVREVVRRERAEQARREAEAVDA